MDKKAEEYLLNIPMWTKKKNTLEQVGSFLEELGINLEGRHVIHVAGTNGKGSVCAFLTSILTEAGYHVGTFTSPHLVDVRERIAVDGTMSDPVGFQKAFEQVLAVTERMVERRYVHPTFFEYLFLMSMVLFHEQKVDYVILETGLGGRLDTTNVFRKPLATVITSISLDHTEYLGTTIEEIAAEKAGIIKAGVPVVYDVSSGAAAKVIAETAARNGAPAYPVDGESLQNLLQGEISWTAEYQKRNAALVYQLMKVLHLPNVDQSVVTHGIAATRWPGRMEEIQPGIYLDGAHNPGGIAALVETAGNLQKRLGKKIVLLFAAVSDKDYTSMVQELCEGLELEQVVVVHIANKRALDVKSLAEVFEAYATCPVRSFDTVADAAAYTWNQKREDNLIFCAGSLYLIGEIKDNMTKGNYIC